MKYRVLIMQVNPNSLVELKEGDIPLNSFYDSERKVWKIVYLSPEEEAVEEEKEPEGGKEPEGD